MSSARAWPSPGMAPGTPGDRASRNPVDGCLPARTPSRRNCYCVVRPRSPRPGPGRMLLFQKRFHAGLVDGSVRLTFRRWEKPHVKKGGRYRCHPIGVLEVDAVDRVPVGAIGEEDARAAGFTSREELLGFMSGGPAGPLAPDSEVWRVALHHGGDGDRVEIALDDRLSAEEV